MQYKQFPCQFECDLKFSDGKTATAIISSGRMDRDGEILEPGGADLSDYNKNPVVLANHQHRSFPVGKSLWTRYDQIKDRIVSKCKFAPTSEGDKTHSLVKGGFLSGVSIGFEPIEARRPSLKEKQLHGAGLKKIISKWSLLEWSFVNFPSNVDAGVIEVKADHQPEVLSSRRPPEVATIRQAGQEKHYLDREFYEVDVLGRV